jgi:hypothetical protein
MTPTMTAARLDPAAAEPALMQEWFRTSLAVAAKG